MSLPFCEHHRLYKDKICAADGCCLLACDLCFQSHTYESNHEVAVILNYMSKAFFEEWNHFFIS